MKIACVSSILKHPWGSPDRLWTELARRSQQRGDAVFLGISPLTANNPEVALLQTGGAEVFLRMEHSLYRGRRDQLVRRLPWRRHHVLETQLARFAPELVIITQGATYDSLAEHHFVNWLHSSRTPYLVICHNNNEAEPPGEENIARLRTFFNGAAQTLFVSSHNLRVAEKHLGGSLPRAGLIQNPLPLNLPAALPTPPVSAIPVLGLVGRLDIQHKGIDLLLAAVAALPKHSVKLIFTGHCENPDAMNTLIAAHHLQDCVELRGPTKPDQVARAYGELELFLLPSRFEGCASAMLEAMMCGRAVLATPVGGVDDWIEDGINGYVAPAISVEALTATLSRAPLQRENWPAMGVAARRAFDQRRASDPVGSLLRSITVNPLTVT